MNENNSMSYCLKKIALLEINNIEDINETHFIYKNKNYLKLFDFCKETLISDVKRNIEFSLRTIEIDNNEYLAIYITIIGPSSRSHTSSRIRLLELCFTNLEECELNENLCLDAKHTDSYVTQKIYDLLKISHENQKYDENVENTEVQHCNLIPTLREYQKRAVKWLLNREFNTEKIKSCYKEIYSKELCNIKFYLDMNNLNIYDKKPVDVIMPRGGILADEMGLGKTIEVISLILLNPWKKITHADSTDSDNSTDSEHSMEKRIKLTEKFFCVCSKSKYSKDSIAKCKKCGVLQHSKCVNFNIKSRNYPHYCPDCWKSMEIEGCGTVIVTPSSIKDQWYQEILKHTKTLKVFQYNGIFNGWISPKELSKYDVILLDYNTLKREIRFLSENISNRSSRRKPQCMRLTSPLMMIHWWRVCLDEAQLVESTMTQSAQMVRKLKTKHRWSVTGTPIQKSINDLRGIIKFLDIYPFYEPRTWDSLVTKFLNDNTSDFMTIFEKIMWRTSKQNVKNELSIPDQLSEKHLVQLTDAERLYYESWHTECKDKFSEVVEKLISSTTVIISQINPNVLKTILEPLKKLRQDCTVPIILSQNLKQNIKKYLQPEELMQHLKKTNEIECRNQLRSITSNFNGLAGLYIIKNEYQKAIPMYKNVLRFSKDYTGNVCVDSLLQIHAIYNLRWIYLTQNVNKNEINELDTSLLRLEWKYLNPYYENLKEAELNFESSQKLILDSQDEQIIKDSELFCIQMLEALENEKLIQQLLVKISEDLPQNKIKLSNIHGIEFYLCNWFKKLFTYRNKIIQKFTPLLSFIELIKPNTSCTPEMEQFITAIFDCHLNQIRLLEAGDENLNLNSANKSVPICKLCTVKTVINKYECVLFDKKFNDGTQIIKGSWNPSFEENLLKIIFIFSKNKNLELSIIKNFEDILNLLDDLKKEFKTVTKLWIEIEYMVKAYDELNMSIVRLQIDDNCDNTDNENKVLYKISKYEVDLYLEDMKGKIMVEQNLFARKLGRLKYLQHLENGSEPAPCPICHAEPSDKYSVLECGHHMCMVCLNALIKNNRYNLMCAVCRNSQKVTDLHFVKMKTKLSGDEIQIKGNCSTKIDKIVTLIMKLKNENKDIKILIFSHWVYTLEAISNALLENDVLHRFRWSTKSINEFKDPSLGITCLLLTLAHGAQGLNLIEATHVILVEPILSPGEELQAIGRVHRIGQTKVTTVHRFIVKNTIEEKIYNVTTGNNNWEFNKITIDQIKEFFQ